MMKHSVTIVIPALNEEENIQASYNKSKSALVELHLEHEIILVNDGSSDNTLEIMQSIDLNDPVVQVINHSISQGIGFAYKKGVGLSKKTHFLLIPGDDDFDKTQIKKIVKQIGQKEIIIPFHKSQKNRPLKRRIFSKLFTKFLNLLFNLDLKYYNGIVLHETKNLSKISIKSDGYTYQAEILIKLFRKKNFSHNFVEIQTNENEPKNSKAIKLINFLDVLVFIFRMLMDVYFLKR